MKLIRCGAVGLEQPGLLLNDGRRIDASGFGSDYDEAFFGGDGLARLATWAAAQAATAPTVNADVRLGPPLTRPSKLICIGLNYRGHAAETGAAVPKEPIVFMKATSAIVGPNDDVVIPRASEKTDWEVELAVVIGKKASYVDEASALDHVAGYVLHNDYSERAFQLERGTQWSKGKSCDTFAPLGPFIATPDEIDAENVELWLDVNGEKKQRGSTNDFVFGVATVISYISQFMSLLPGDVISTGTPAGVGMGEKPPRYLTDGDVITLGIAGLGEQRQTARAYR
ncbi:fumarylacetoacetate hydrolase family protein [soil metagenome]